MADWNTTRTTGETLLLTGTRAEAQLLNRHARAILAASGELDLATQTTFAGRQYAVGDHIVFVRNDRHQRLTNGDPFVVDNGMRGTVTDLTTEQMTITTAIGKHVVVDRSYLDRGWVDHAYAVTIHKAQGVTCDHVLVVGPAGLYREGAYVALSRARHSARLYATTADTAGLDERHAHGIPLPTETQRDPQAELLARLQRSASKNLVSVDDPQAARIAEIVEHYEDAVRNAISLGGDADTMACIAGGIAEAFYGGVPEDIRVQTLDRLDMRLRGIVEEFDERYACGRSKR